MQSASFSIRPHLVRRTPTHFLTVGLRVKATDRASDPLA
jgi:hypothetical protein